MTQLVIGAIFKYYLVILTTISKRNDPDHGWIVRVLLKKRSVKRQK